ncbi:hypothetical protein TrRE_jg11756, partial [Triparma retinervis]
MNWIIKPNDGEKVLGSNADGTTDLHRIAVMPFPFSDRECVIRRSIEVDDEESWVITRTCEEKDARTVKKNPLRVYVDVHIGGYFLEAISPNLTKVTYLVGGDLKGVFALDWMARRAGPHHLKEAVL